MATVGMPPELPSRASNSVASPRSPPSPTPIGEGGAFSFRVDAPAALFFPFHPATARTAKPVSTTGNASRARPMCRFCAWMF
jgi:hypothetical protein